MLALAEKLIEDDSIPYSRKNQISARLIENAAFQRRRFLNKTSIFVFCLQFVKLFHAILLYFWHCAGVHLLKQRSVFWWC